jgi:hypothetical protein
MSSTSVRRIAALLTCLGCGALVGMPAGAFATPSHHHVATVKHKKKPAHPSGFFITGQGKVTSITEPAALVRDSNGGEHVVTSQVSASAAGNEGHIIYLTRKAGATKWTSHPIPQLVPMAGKIGVETHLSTDGTRVFAVYYRCDGVYVSDTSLTSTRMPLPTLVQSRDTCSDPTPTGTAPIEDAVPLFNHQIGILLPDPAQSGKNATFTPQPALPTTDSFVPTEMTLDASGERLVVVGDGNDGTNNGVYLTSESVFSGVWTPPVQLATLNSATANYVIQAVASYRGSTWIGMSRPAGFVAHPSHTLFVVHLTPSGQSNGVIPLAHSTPADRALRLSYNNATGHLHAVYTRVNPNSHESKSGILHQALISGHWAKPKFLTHWYHDTASQITVTAGGSPVIGYEQR